MMRHNDFLRRTLIAATLLLAALPANAQTDTCPVPPALALSGIALPTAKAAVQAGKRLVILAVGGAATAGSPARGQDYTVPARLAEHLRRLLPGVEVSVMTRAAVRRPARVTVTRLDADLAETAPSLVIWGVGATEAGHHVDAATLATDIAAGTAKIRAAHADLLLVDLQYTPAIAHAMNLTPYRDVTIAAARAADIPLLDRFALMQNWHETGVLNLEAKDPRERVRVARQLFDCLANTLADGIADAVR